MRKAFEVLRVTLSPLNNRRWCLGLACGHELWVTAKRRPTRRTAVCVDPGCAGVVTP
jgi:hypothetical protein